MKLNKVAMYEEEILSNIMEKTALNRFNREMIGVTKREIQSGKMPNFSDNTRLGQYLKQKGLNTSRRLDDFAAARHKNYSSKMGNTHWGSNTPSSILDFNRISKSKNTGLSSSGGERSKRMTSLIAKNKERLAGGNNYIKNNTLQNKFTHAKKNTARTVADYYF